MLAIVLLESKTAQRQLMGRLKGGNNPRKLGESSIYVDS